VQARPVRAYQPRPGQSRQRLARDAPQQHHAAPPSPRLASPRRAAGVALMQSKAGVIVSAADARYFRCLLQLLASVARVDPAQSLDVICYDLGLTPGQRAQLAARFPRAALRSYDLQRQRAFMRLRARTHNSNAWKPQL